MHKQVVWWHSSARNSRLTTHLCIQASDHAAIVSNLCEMAKYLEASTDSLLNRIVGCYQLQFHPEVPPECSAVVPTDGWCQETPIYVIVIVNIMWAPKYQKPKLLFKFDLKGSSVDRQEIKDQSVLDECTKPGSAGWFARTREYRQMLFK